MARNICGLIPSRMFNIMGMGLVVSAFVGEFKLYGAKFDGILKNMVMFWWLVVQWMTLICSFKT